MPNDTKMHLHKCIIGYVNTFGELLARHIVKQEFGFYFFVYLGFIWCYVAVKSMHFYLTLARNKKKKRGRKKVENVNVNASKQKSQLRFSLRKYCFTQHNKLIDSQRLI